MNDERQQRINEINERLGNFNAGIITDLPTLKMWAEDIAVDLHWMMSVLVETDNQLSSARREIDRLFKVHHISD